MNIRRQNKLLVEPPALATGDIAFNLIVFFLVCASVQPDTGKIQEIPKAEPNKDKKQQSNNIEVALGKNTVVLNGNPVTFDQIRPRLTSLLSARKRPEDKVVVVKTSKQKDTEYDFWIKVTGEIEAAGGVVTLQLEEERVVQTE